MEYLVENSTFLLGIISASTAPRDLTVDSAGETKSLTVTWTAPERMNGELAYYEVQYSYSGGDTQYKKVYDGTSTVLGGLEPCTTYEVSVTATTDPNDEKTGPATPKVEGRTADDGEFSSCIFNQ